MIVVICIHQHSCSLIICTAHKNLFHSIYVIIMCCLVIVLSAIFTKSEFLHVSDVCRCPSEEMTLYILIAIGIAFFGTLVIGMLVLSDEALNHLVTALLLLQMLRGTGESVCTVILWEMISFVIESAIMSLFDY